MPIVRKIDPIEIPPPKGWQQALLVALQQGRSLQDACAAARVSEEFVRATYARSSIFRTAYEMAMRAAEQRTTVSPEIIESTNWTFPVTRARMSFPAWTSTFFSALLSGQGMSDACKQAGVSADQVAQEQRRNPLFRLAARALLHTPDPKQRYDAIIALLDRMIADAVVAARVLPSRARGTLLGEWIASLPHALRDGLSLTQAATLARVPPEDLNDELQRNPALADAFALFDLFMPLLAPFREQQVARDTRAESVLAQMTETGVYEIVPDTDETLAGLMVDLRAAVRRRGARIWFKKYNKQNRLLAWYDAV